MTNEDRLRTALKAIADLARSLVEDGDAPSIGAAANGHGRASVLVTCTPKALPERLLVPAARTAVRINPMNQPLVGGSVAAVGGAAGIMQPQRIALLTSKYWRPVPRTLTVSFLETTPSDLRARIISHMNAWTKTGCISFAETNDVGEVRISRGGDGFWSYLGTDILHIPADQQTMNLQGFSMSTHESEYHRVIRHETGHTLGFPHEHMRAALVARIDKKKAYDFFWRTQRWDPAMVDAQVLTPLNETDLIATTADENSIMCYQLPGEITIDGEPIAGGLDIDDSDYAFAGKVYPKPAVPAGGSDGAAVGSWPESQDILEPVS